jgi:hypothetical protein
VSRHRELNEVDDRGERRGGEHPSECNLGEGLGVFRSALMDGEHQADQDRRHHEDEDLGDSEVRIGERLAGVAN